MPSFDEDMNIDDFLADEEPELSDPKYRFRERVNVMVKRHNLLRREAEEIIKTVIYTKETSKRCKCGAVADVAVNGEIYCGACEPKTDFL